MRMYHLEQEGRDKQANFSPGEFLFTHPWDMPSGISIEVHHHDWHEFVWNRPIHGKNPADDNARPHELIFDGRVYHYGRGDLLYLPPFHDHGFRTAPGLQIVVIGIDEWSLGRLLGRSSLSAVFSGMLEAWQGCGPTIHLGKCFLDTLLTDPEPSSLAGKLRILLELERIQSQWTHHPKRLEESPARPEKNSGTLEEVLIRKALAYLEANFREGPSVASCAAALATGRSTLSRRFSACMGVSIPVYLQRIRIRHAMTLLNQSGLEVTDIALECGFSDASHFARVFREHCGLSPTEWRRTRTGLHNMDNRQHKDASGEEEPE